MKSLEEQFALFTEIANSIGMDTTPHCRIPLHFGDNDTTNAWVIYTRAYWEGIKDGLYE